MVNIPLFYFYKRYKWRAQDFTKLQTALYDFARIGVQGIAGGTVVSGLDATTSVGLTQNIQAGIAIAPQGDLLAFDAPTGVSVTANVKSLIVARPVSTDTNIITQPTSPFNLVPLNQEHTSIVVAIPGTAGAYPSKQANDTILLGVTADGAGITDVDKTQCEFHGKKDERIAGELLVGNKRHAKYRTLADAIAAAQSGNKVKVLESAAIASTVSVGVSDIDIEFAPGVTYSKGAAATGILLAASGVKLIGGRFSGYAAAGEVPIAITSVYCSILGTRFADVTGPDTNTIIDVPGKSVNSGVIYEL